jgi:catechol 2,3-dioxygenase-like lactoylglutathione lyase family enzyme
MAIIGIHHVSLTVTDLERTIDFYQNTIGMRLVARKHRQAGDLGSALFGAEAGEAEILIADMELGDTRIEFIQYVRPATKAYGGDPSVAGSAHVAILTWDIEGEFHRLQAAGVRFHTPVRTVRDPGRPVWRWCYFRDPDGICVELVESAGSAGSESPASADCDGVGPPASCDGVGPAGIGRPEEAR